MKSRFLSTCLAVLAAITLSSVADGQSVIYDTYAMYDGYSGVYGYAHVTTWECCEILLAADAYLYAPDNSLLASNSSEGYTEANAYVYGTAYQSGNYSVWGDYYSYYYYGWIWLGTSGASAYVPNAPTTVTRFDPHYTPWRAPGTYSVDIEGSGLGGEPILQGGGAYYATASWSGSDIFQHGEIQIRGFSGSSIIEIWTGYDHQTLAGTIEIVGYPEGETSIPGPTWIWGPPKLVAVFSAALLPAGNDGRYDGNSVFETFGFGIQDTCFEQDRRYQSQLPAVPSTWAIGLVDGARFAGRYGYDGIGSDRRWVDWYNGEIMQGRISPCGWSSTQIMNYAPLYGGSVPYDIHPIGFYVDATEAFAQRSDTWQTISIAPGFAYLGGK